MRLCEILIFCRCFSVTCQVLFWSPLCLGENGLRNQVLQPSLSLGVQVNRTYMWNVKIYDVQVNRTCFEGYIWIRKRSQIYDLLFLWNGPQSDTLQFWGIRQNGVNSVLTKAERQRRKHGADKNCRNQLFLKPFLIWAKEEKNELAIRWKWVGWSGLGWPKLKWNLLLYGCTTSSMCFSII